MVAEVSPEVMARRMRQYAEVLSLGGMSTACAAGLRPVRTAARKKNFGFIDRTKRTRKRIGKVRRYKIATARRYKGGGAYFRFGGRITARLEYDFGKQYSFIAPAFRQTRGAQLERFLIAGRKEVIRAAKRARSRG